MMRKVYIYFASYVTENQHGRCQVTRNQPVTSMDHVEEMEQSIMALGRVNSYPTIMNYQLLRESTLVD
jgi:hypothetical protein